MEKLIWLRRDRRWNKERDGRERVEWTIAVVDSPSFCTLIPSPIVVDCLFVHHIRFHFFSLSHSLFFLVLDQRLECQAKLCPSPPSLLVSLLWWWFGCSSIFSICWNAFSFCLSLFCCSLCFFHSYLSLLDQRLEWTQKKVHSSLCFFHFLFFFFLFFCSLSFSLS